jgi:hypothetical protein
MEASKQMDIQFLLGVSRSGCLSVKRHIIKRHKPLLKFQKSYLKVQLYYVIFTQSSFDWKQDLSQDEY